MLRILVCEDDPVARHLLVAILTEEGRSVVVGEAADGAEAVRMAEQLLPDVVTMDVHMPRMNGILATRSIMERTPRPVVIVSAHDPEDAAMSVEALQAGALAVVAKPPGPSAPDFEPRAEELRRTVASMAELKVVTRRSVRDQPIPLPPPATLAERAASRPPAEIAAIAASTGGPAALRTLLAALGPHFPVPVVIVQHIAAGYHGGLARWLETVCPLPVAEASDGARLLPGHVWLAPGGTHLEVGSGGRANLVESAPVSGHRPSATPLFRSVARAFGSRAAGVILTGMGSDGVDGLADLHRAGGLTLAQDEASCVVYGMPGEAVHRGVVDRALPLDQIAVALHAAVRRSGSRAASPAA